MYVKIMLFLQNTDKQKSGSTTESLYVLLLIPQKKTLTVKRKHAFKE